MKQDKIFNLEHQYQLYLKRVAIKESDMMPVQRKETRQAFMGACGQMIFLFRDDLTKLGENEAVEVMKDMKNQIGDYFMKITNKYN